MKPSSMWCLQDLFSFCAFALLLHIGIFVLYITRARTYYHGPSDVVKRVANIFLGAFPTGLATVLIFSLVLLLPISNTHTVCWVQKTPTGLATILIFSLVVLLPIINIHAVCVQGTDLLPPPVLFA